MKRTLSVLGFSLALSLVVLNLVNTKYILIIAVGLAALLVASLIIGKYRKALVLPLTLSACLLACLLMLFNFSASVGPQLSLDGKQADIVFYATDTPRRNSSGGFSAPVRIMHIEKDGAPQGINSYIYVDSDDEIVPYDIYSASARLSKVADSAFSSRGLWADKEFLTVSTDDVAPTGKHYRCLGEGACRMRSRIINAFDKNMSSDEAGLSIALTTGNKAYLSADTRSAFSSAGVSHIMAISGFHLCVAVGMLTFMLRLLRVNKRITSAVGIAACLAYMSIAGFTGSVTRAGIMLIIMSLATVLGRRGDALNSLGLAVFLMCLNPFAVCDVGFALSVVATLSLITVYPLVSHRFAYKDFLEPTSGERLLSAVNKWISAFYISIVVAICTLPVIYMFFGYVSVISPVSNLVVVPLGSMSMLTSFLRLYNVSAYLNSLIISYVRLAASFDGSVFGFSVLSHSGLAIAGVLIIFALCLALNRKSLLKPAVALSTALVLIVGTVDYVVSRDNAAVYFTDDGAYAISYDDKLIVGGVDSFDDCTQIKRFVASNGGEIDYLIIDDGEEYYPVLLSNSVSVGVVVAGELNDSIIASGRYYRLEEYNKFNLVLADDFKMYYNFGEVCFDIRSLTFSASGGEADIVLKNNKVQDCNGTISLDYGGVVYSIENKNAFTARRISKWQE